MHSIFYKGTIIFLFLKVEFLILSKSKKRKLIVMINFLLKTLS